MNVQNSPARIVQQAKLVHRALVTCDFILIICMFAMTGGERWSDSERNVFFVFAVASIVCFAWLFKFRCNECDANLYFRRGFFMLTWGLRFIPVWILPMPKSCEGCGKVRFNEQN